MDGPSKAAPAGQAAALWMSTIAFTVCFAVWTIFSIIGVQVKNDLGLNDTPTAGYNLLRMEVSNRQYWQYSPWGPTEIVAGLTGANLLDVDVRNSVQFHKDEILLPGRSIKFFMNAKLGGAPPPSKAPAGYYNSPVGFAAPSASSTVMIARTIGRGSPAIGSKNALARPVESGAITPTLVVRVGVSSQS